VGISTQNAVFTKSRKIVSVRAVTCGRNIEQRLKALFDLWGSFICRPEFSFTARSLSPAQSLLGTLYGRDARKRRRVCAARRKAG